MDTILQPITRIKEEIIEKLEHKSDPESQVIVHCLFEASGTFESFIRIWPSTYLYDNKTSHRSHLVHIEKITLFPNWMLIPAGSRHYFTLIFTGLPKSCRNFDLVEQIPQSGGFEVRDIARNETDVYFVSL